VNLWTEKYRLNTVMIPNGLISFELARKILLTGKAVNFIRICCKEQDWMLEPGLYQHLPQSFESLLAPSAADVVSSEAALGLKQLVDEAYSVTNQALLKILLAKYRLAEHCGSIRRYLLMAQGDFMQCLMDNLSEELSNPASQIYRHTLQAHLETAVRHSNAQYHEPEFLQRLSIRLLESSPGDKGWEVFSLDYTVSDLAPLAAVFTPEVMEAYQKIFNFLWRLKRIEHLLSQSWRSYQEHVHRYQQIRGMKGVFHQFNLMHHEMAHFVSTIHNYIMVEVLEAAWKIFQDELRGAGDLDQVIAVQGKFVRSILDKALLNERTNQLSRQLHRILNQVYVFTFKKLKFFYPQALSEWERQGGGMGGDREGAEEEDAMFSDREHLRQIVEQMKANHEEFYRFLVQFKLMLGEQKNVAGQLDLRYMLFRLDFNEYY
jgi:gamma-tubulin complex component 3